MPLPTRIVMPVTSRTPNSSEEDADDIDVDVDHHNFHTMFGVRVLEEKDDYGHVKDDGKDEIKRGDPEQCAYTRCVRACLTLRCRVCHECVETKDHFVFHL